MVNILYQSSVFDDVAQIIRSSLHKQNIKPVHINADSDSDSDSDLCILLGANDLVLERFPKKYVVYQFEQVNAEGSKNWFEGEYGLKYIQILKNALAVYDYSSLNCSLLKSKFEINATFVPIYNDLPVNRVNRVNRVNDVLFCGAINDRRNVILNKLRKAGLKVATKNNLWRETLDYNIKSSKVCLNLHYYPNATLETTRLLTLLRNNATVVSEKSTDKVLDKSFEDLVVFADYDDIVDKTIELVKKATNHSNNTCNTCNHEFVFPIEYINTHTAAVEETNLPEPDMIEFDKAETKENDSVLVLPKKPELEDMPYVSIITPTRNRPVLFQIVKRNMMLLNYPDHKIEWIIVDDSDNDLSNTDLKIGNVKIRYFHLDKVTSISDKRNFGASKAEHEIIVHMDDDDYYNPDSLFSRVKTLITNSKRYGCVGISDYAVYHLIDDYSFKINTQNISEASMCYFKSFWEKQQFKEDPRGEGYCFLKGRRKQCLTIQYQFCMVAITHGKNITNNLRSVDLSKKNHSIFNNWTYSTQRFFTKIYKQLEVSS